MSQYIRKNSFGSRMRLPMALAEGLELPVPVTTLRDLFARWAFASRSVMWGFPALHPLTEIRVIQRIF